MSRIALSGDASGTGTFTIASPNSNSNFTATLPANTGTIVTNNSTPAFASTIGVGGATAAASGAGITFPATQSASSDANTLDDYEEGTFTPVLSFDNATTGITYNVQTGRYTKVGRLVTCSFTIRLTNKGSATGVARISLPFSSDEYAQPNLPGYTGYAAYTNLGATGFIVGNNGAAGIPTNSTTSAYLTNANFANDSFLVMTISYNV